MCGRVEQAQPGLLGRRTGSHASSDLESVHRKRRADAQVALSALKHSSVRPLLAERAR